VRRALQRGGIQDYRQLPRGAVIAIARVVDCVPASELLAGGLSKRQQTFGDYGPGQWAWQLADVQQFAEPEPARGALGLWNCPRVGVPDDHDSRTHGTRTSCGLKMVNHQAHVSNTSVCV
jgi:hypothetical protein